MNWDSHDRERPQHMTDDHSCWEMFSAAILRKALEDYKFGGVRRRQEVERFIRSDYFSNISNIDVKWLLKNMKLLIPKSIDHA